MNDGGRYSFQPPNVSDLSAHVAQYISAAYRRVGRGNNATAGVVCPAHVKAAFNFEFDDIDIDVPLEEFLVEASKETPRWRVMLTPLPGAAGEPDSQSTPGCGDKVI